MLQSLMVARNTFMAFIHPPCLNHQPNPNRVNRRCGYRATVANLRRGSQDINDKFVYVFRLFSTYCIIGKLGATGRKTKAGKPNDKFVYVFRLLSASWG